MKTKAKKLKAIIEYGVERGFEQETGAEDYVIRYLPRMAGKKKAWDWWVTHILFSHDFAKAFWGERERCSCGGRFYSDKGQRLCIGHEWVKNWQHHLQQCVISEDIIEYYYQHIEQT